MSGQVLARAEETRRAQPGRAAQANVEPARPPTDSRAAAHCCVLTLRPVPGTRSQPLRSGEVSPAPRGSSGLRLGRGFRGDTFALNSPEGQTGALPGLSV